MRWARVSGGTDPIKAPGREPGDCSHTSPEARARGLRVKRPSRWPEPLMLAGMNDVAQAWPDQLARHVTVPRLAPGAFMAAGALAERIAGDGPHRVNKKNAPAWASEAECSPTPVGHPSGRRPPARPSRAGQAVRVSPSCCCGQRPPRSRSRQPTDLDTPASRARARRGHRLPPAG